MGISLSQVGLLIGMHARRPFSAPVLTLGVPDVYATYEQAVTLIDEQGLNACEVPVEQRRQHCSVVMPKLGYDPNRYLHSETLFRLLGLPGCETLDGSPVEHPTIVHDLNTQLDASYWGRYGLLVDCGTLEHIFDIRAALTNLVRLVRIGGEVLHISPMSGWVNHGFFQISPCLYFDFYQANGFKVREAYVMDGSNGPTKPSLYQPYAHSNLRVKLKLPGKPQSPNREVFLIFLAEKQCEMAEIVVPTQGKYRSRFQKPTVRLALPAPRAAATTAAG